MQSKGGGILKNPLKKGISKVFKKITRRSNAANPTGLRLKNPNVRTKRPASSGHKNRMHNISQKASGGLKKFNKSMGNQDLSKLKPTSSKWGGDKAGGGLMNNLMRNPAVAKKYQLEGFANVPLGKMAKDGIANVGRGRKISTTQAEATKGAFAKKPLPMPFPMMAGGGNIAARAGQYMSALMDDSIEFASVSKMIRQAKKHSVKKGGIFVDNAPISGSTGHLRGKKYGYKKGTANKSEWLARGAYRTPKGARGAQARYKIKSSVERANRG